MNLLNVMNNPSEEWDRERRQAWETVKDIQIPEYDELDTENDILVKAKQLVERCEEKMTVPTYNWKVLLTRHINFELAYTFCEMWQKKHPEVDIILPVFHKDNPITYREL